MSGSEGLGGGPRRLGPRLASIAFGTPFLPTLARHLLDWHGEGEALARVRVLLPTGRARRALVEAFLEAVAGRALLLPRILAIAEVEEQEELGRLLEEGSAAPLPPAITPLGRRLALARLLLAESASPAGADRLARDLARVMDLLSAHGVAAARLADVEEQTLARHRERRLAVLQAISAHWPGLLQERGAMDPVQRREALLAALADRWRSAPPGPVVAAGFASAPPAVARLLHVIARLDEGLVVLPGLDPEVSTDAWEKIGEAPTHPLNGLHGLMSALGANPADALPLGAPASPRARVLTAAFAAPPQRASVRRAAPTGLCLVECAGPETEALAIALAMRRALDVPGRTAALVTRSRPLARRVAAALARWGLKVEDSAGEPLSARPAGAFLLALLAAAAERFRPVALLAALKHPLAGGASPETRARWLERVRALDLALRGPAPAPGLAGITDRLRQRRQAPIEWWEEEALPLLAGLERLFIPAGAPSVATLVGALAEAGEALAGDRLWAGPDGRALAELVAGMAASPDSSRMAPAREESLAFLMGLFADVPVRPPWRQHPRLMILGPLEARLQHADLMILADMNEGSWPALPAIDPWLPPSVRRALGLPPVETRIGLEAHDLLSASAGDLMLTRARRDAGGPTVRSRFLLRLEAAFGALAGDAELEAALALDGRERTIMLPRPAPAPPPAERPRKLRVTEADMLAADPFAFYARRMLGLRRLDPLEQEADAAVRGTAVHRILERLVKERPSDPVRLIDEELAALGGDPALRLLWRPRVRRMLAWVREELANDATGGWAGHHAEVALAAEWMGVSIEGKADRIDAHADGALRIIDYKTGTLPKVGPIREGRYRQLPLLRLLVEQGGAGALSGEVQALEYWKPSGNLKPGERRAVELERAALEADMAQLFTRWLFGGDPFVPKLIPVFAKGYRDFDQLARVEEWL